jgi:hypothetical protein
MPRNAPRTKLDATRGYGAEIVIYDPETASREQVAYDLVFNERGGVLIPPFDHRDVVAGQGTAALELIEECGPLDALFVPCGGGGLLSGSALAASAQPGCRVIGVEPELADDATRTFRSGSLQRVENPPTIADGLRTPSLGDVTWPLVRANVSEMITVSEEEIIEAMRFLWRTMKLVVEPSGAVGLAGLIKRRIEPGARAGVIISGGNVDLDAAFVVELDGRSFVMADIPGLIEGASEGAGLGTRFLGHVERCGVLLHLIDATGDDVVGAWRTVRGELESYGHGLSEKREVIALNKTDAMTQEDLAVQAAWLAEASGAEVFGISAIAGDGVRPVLFRLLKEIDAYRAAEKAAEAGAPAEGSPTWLPQ